MQPRRGRVDGRNFPRCNRSYIRQLPFRTPSGFYLPGTFDGGDTRAFVERRALLKKGADLFRANLGGRDYLKVLGVEYPDRDHLNEQWTARDHAEECAKLDRTRAGARAAELLMSALSPVQRRDAQQKRWFEVCLINPYRLEDNLRWEPRRYYFSVARFRFNRGWPNGNIFMGHGTDPFTYNICLHPLQPYPTDDIVLAQYMLLLSDPDTFIQTGNFTRIEGNKKILGFTNMFGRPEEHRLILP